MSRRRVTGVVMDGPGPRPGVALIAVLLAVGLGLAAWSAGCRPDAESRDRTEVVVP